MLHRQKKLFSQRSCCCAVNITTGSDHWRLSAALPKTKCGLNQLSIFEKIPGNIHAFHSHTQTATQNIWLSQKVLQPNVSRKQTEEKVWFITLFYHDTKECDEAGKKLCIFLIVHTVNESETFVIIKAMNVITDMQANWTIYLSQWRLLMVKYGLRSHPPRRE